MVGKHCLATKHASQLLGTPCGILQHRFAIQTSASAGYMAVYALAEEPEQNVSVMLHWLACLSRKRLVFTSISRDKIGCTEQQRNLDYSLDISLQMLALKLPLTASQRNVTV